jgi:hypothetical protein
MLELTRESVREILLLDEDLDFTGANQVRMENLLNSFTKVLTANFGLNQSIGDKVKSIITANTTYVREIESVQNDFRSKIRRISDLTSARNQLAKDVVTILNGSNENYGTDSETISSYVESLDIKSYFNENYLINAIKVLLKGDNAHTSQLR